MEVTKGTKATRVTKVSQAACSWMATGSEHSPRPLGFTEDGLLDGHSWIHRGLLAACSWTVERMHCSLLTVERMHCLELCNLRVVPCRCRHRQRCVSAQSQRRSQRRPSQAGHAAIQSLELGINVIS